MVFSGFQTGILLRLTAFLALLVLLVWMAQRQRIKLPWPLLGMALILLLGMHSEFHAETKRIQIGLGTLLPFYPVKGPFGPQVYAFGRRCASRPGWRSPFPGIGRGGPRILRVRGTRARVPGWTRPPRPQSTDAPGQGCP